MRNDEKGENRGQVIQIDEARIKDHHGEMVRGMVEEALNAMLDAEADQLCGAGRYERNEGRMDTRAGSYDRSLHTKAGEVNLKIPKLRRIRDKEHQRFVASQPRLICGRSPGHAHHLRFAQPRAMGRKISDEWTVLLCATHHRSLHTVGDEEKWWQARGTEPILQAEQLWREERDRSVDQPNKDTGLVWPTPR